MQTSQVTATTLVAFDGVKESLKIALAETIMVLSLNDFKENRPDHIFRKNLQQITVLVAVNEQLQILELTNIFAHPRNAVVDRLIVRAGRLKKGDAALAQSAHRRQNVGRCHRQMLNARAFVLV